MKTGFKPIESKFLEPNHLFALGFREGWIFGRVIKRRLVQFKPYKVIDSNGNAIDVPAGSYASQGNLRFRDPRNTQNDTLFLSESTDQGLAWLLHGGFGIKPNWINAYFRFPEAQDISGRFPNVDPISPPAGDDTGYTNGIKSPYEKPMDPSEVIITPKQHISAEYYNKDPNYAHQPVINLLFSVYWFQALNRSMHRNLISDIAMRRKPAAFFTVGFGQDPLPYDLILEKDWGETAMTLEEASALSGGAPSFVDEPRTQEGSRRRLLRGGQ